MTRKITILMLLVVLALVMSSCGGKDAKTTTEKADKAKEAADTSKTADLGQVGKKPKDVRSVDYSDPQICGGCHDEISSQWSNSMHNNAYTDPIYLKVLAKAKAEGGGEFDEFCSACHTPIGFTSGELPPWVDANLSAIAKKGVQCDFCHTVKAVTGIGNYQFLSSPGDIKRGPFKDAISPYHDTAYSEIHTEAEFCGMCHNVNLPANGLPLEATYMEWKNGPYAKKGIICQDCHMTPGPGVTKPNPGVAAVGAKKRKHIWTHSVVGGNIAVPTLLGNTAHQDLVRERLQAAAAVMITKEPLKVGAKNTVEVAVTNKGCGHYLPTGLTETREMWLDISINDATGRVIFRSGALDDKGEIDKNAVIYKTVVADKEGQETHAVWFADKILSDKRIPPKATVSESYQFDVAGDVVAPLSATATLKYRSASQKMIDELFGPGQIAVPVVEMVKAVVTIE